MEGFCIVGQSSAEVGVEYAVMFAMLGTKVTIIDAFGVFRVAPVNCPMLSLQYIPASDAGIVGHVVMLIFEAERRELATGGGAVGARAAGFRHVHSNAVGWVRV